MLVKSQLKLIRSLHQKKYRNQHGLFFVEGKKSVSELLDADFKPYTIFSTNSRLFEDAAITINYISAREMKLISALKNPSSVFGVFHIPKVQEVAHTDWVVALDDLRDPGNLGTIIRLCDWFGIQHIICSAATVDCYNPKVLQASMGSIARVNMVYTDLALFLKKSQQNIYGTYINAPSVYNSNLNSTGILILGNEANGISDEIEELVTQKISIPQFGKQTAESLNVATATGILLNEIRRG